MKYLKNVDGVTENTITMEHRGETLVWNIRTYRNLKVNDNIVTDINHYWSLLPIDKQDAIFTIYKTIYEAYESVENAKRLNDILVEQVGRLFEYHPFDDIMEYFKKYARIKMPPDLKDAYIIDRDVTDLTYLRHEYYDLTGMTIALKTMIPIWGQYIEVMGPEIPINFKEYRASALLKNANIVHCRAYERLARYVRTYWEGYTESHSSAAIVAGLGSLEVPSWLMGHVLFRRISTAELIQLNSPEMPQTIISAIFNYIDHLTKTMDKQFGGRINEKSLEKSSGDDDNTSVAENYKIKQEISEETIVSYEVYLTHHTEQILHRLAPYCPVELLQQTIQNAAMYFTNGFEPTILSKAITQWTIDPVIVAKMLDYVDYTSMVNAHAIAYTLLKHWGYHSLALIVFAQRHNQQMINNVVRQQITDEQLDKLSIIYPHSPNINTKRKPSRRDSNVAVAAIRHVISSLYSTWWKIPDWEDGTQYPQLRIENQLMGLPFDIEVELADLIIFLKTEIHPGLCDIVINQTNQN